MRHIARILFAAAVVSLFASVPTAHATSEATYLTTYYDSSFNVAGWYQEDCDHNETSDGTLDGDWKEVEVTSCVTVGHSYEYYHKCPGGWRRVNYIGDTYCY
jgi:hypothetical protein